MKKMFIVLTSALLVGSGLYAMEKPVEAPAQVAQDTERGQVIVHYSTWDRATGLLTTKDSEDAQAQLYTRDIHGKWFVGDAREVVAAAPVAENLVNGLNALVIALEAKEQTAPMEIVQQPAIQVEQPQVAQPERTFALRLDEKGEVIHKQIVAIKDGILTVISTKGPIVFGVVSEFGSDAMKAITAHPYRTAGHVVEGLYLIGAIVAIPATAGLSYVAGAATPLVTDVALRNVVTEEALRQGRQALRHVSNTGRTMVEKAGKIKRESCSLQ